MSNATCDAILDASSRLAARSSGITVFPRQTAGKEEEDAGFSFERRAVSAAEKLADAHRRLASVSRDGDFSNVNFKSHLQPVQISPLSRSRSARHFAVTLYMHVTPRTRNFSVRFALIMRPAFNHHQSPNDRG